MCVRLYVLCVFTIIVTRVNMLSARGDYDENDVSFTTGQVESGQRFDRIAQEMQSCLDNDLPTERQTNTH